MASFIDHQYISHLLPTQCALSISFVNRKRKSHRSSTESDYGINSSNGSAYSNIHQLKVSIVLTSSRSAYLTVYKPEVHIPSFINQKCIRMYCIHVCISIIHQLERAFWWFIYWTYLSYYFQPEQYIICQLAAHVSSLVNQKRFMRIFKSVLMFYPTYLVHIR